MNFIELNCILYYADYLSLKDLSQPVTDNCKYFFVHSHPVNSAYIAGVEPEYDIENKYFIQAHRDISKIQEMFEEDGTLSFIDDICFLRACGMVDARRMLQHIHMFSSKYERKQAFQAYQQWKTNKTYTHQILDEDGKPKTERCTKFFKHAETAFTRRNVSKSIAKNTESTVEST